VADALADVWMFGTDEFADGAIPLQRWLRKKANARGRRLTVRDPAAILDRDRRNTVVEERYGRGSTLITSQLTVDKWHDVIGEPTLADAILNEKLRTFRRGRHAGHANCATRPPAPAYPRSRFQCR
jgi:hypothetical protein